MKKKITLPDFAIRLGLLAPHILRDKKNGKISRPYPSDLDEAALAFTMGLGANMPMTITEAAKATGVSYAAAHRAAANLTPVLGKAPHYLPDEILPAIKQRRKAGRPARGQTLVELIVSLTIIAFIVTVGFLAIP
jgi:hypothetical protein